MGTDHPADISNAKRRIYAGEPEKKEEVKEAEAETKEETKPPAPTDPKAKTK